MWQTAINGFSRVTVLSASSVSGVTPSSPAARPSTPRTMATKPIPEGYHTVTPYLAVDDAAEAIDYYTKAFGAKERVRMETPDGKVGHAELSIAGTRVMLADDHAIVREGYRSLLQKQDGLRVVAQQCR